MKYKSATETEEKLYEILAEVIVGETIIVTDDETYEPIARIVPRGKLSKRQKLRIASELLANNEN